MLLSHSLQVEAQRWPTLECKDSKIALRARRDESMARKTASDATLTEQRKDRKYQEEKQTLRAQMAVDDTNRQILHDLKAEEKEREERALYESFRALKEQEQRRAQATARGQAENHQQQATLTTMDSSLHAKPTTATVAPAATAKTPTGKTSSALRSPTKSTKPKKRVTFASDVVSTRAQDAKPSSRVVEAPREEEPMVLELGVDGSFDLPTTTVPAPAEPKRTHASERVVAQVDATDDDQDAEALEGKADEALETPSLSSSPSPAVIPVAFRGVPPPRQALQSEIQFTPRVFPTPSRESKAAEEEDWLVKNRQHLSRHKGLRNAGAYDISESDRAYLRVLCASRGSVHGETAP